MLRSILERFPTLSLKDNQREFTNVQKVTVLFGDWNRLLCNGCHGKLLSEG